MSGRRPWPALERDLVAILRGIRPDEVEYAIGTLIDAGFEAIEIPLNSPDPFFSIEKAVNIAGNACLIGAGTVLSVADVRQLAHAGGNLMVSPNVDAEVLCHAILSGMVTMPGVFTATEALAAAALGASALKFFPASALGPGGIAAIRAVLPPATVVAAVGGVADDSFQHYADKGIRVFGLGSSLYGPGMSGPELARRARAAISAYDRVFAPG